MIVNFYTAISSECYLIGYQYNNYENFTILSKAGEIIYQNYPRLIWVRYSGRRTREAVRIDKWFRSKITEQNRVLQSRWEKGNSLALEGGDDSKHFCVATDNHRLTLMAPPPGPYSGTSSLALVFPLLFPLNFNHLRNYFLLCFRFLFSSILVMSRIHFFFPL